MRNILFVNTTFAADLMRISAFRFCSFYKPIKLRPLQSDAEYFELRKGGFYNFPYSYSRFGDCFKLFELAPLVFDRFVQLLAPLTLFHFAKSSKELYYTCLDARGLLFKELSIHTNFDLIPYVRLDGFEGMLDGFCKEKALVSYQVCFSHLRARFDKYLKYPKHLDGNIVKRYKHLEVTFLHDVLKKDIVRFCDAVFHPALEYLTAYFDESNNLQIEREVDLPNFKVFLEYCKHLKIIDIYVAFPIYSEISQIKDMIESWALRATRLEIMVFRHQAYCFQLHEKQLKRCVRLSDGKWYCVVNSYYLSGPQYSSFFYKSIDRGQILKLRHYPDIVKFYETSAPDW